MRKTRPIYFTRAYFPYHSFYGALFLSACGDVYSESSSSTSSIDISDDYTDDTSTSSNFSTSSDAAGAIETSDDIDWHRVELDAGYEYSFIVDPQSELDVKIDGLFDAFGDPVISSDVDASDDGGNETLSYVVTTSGTYYIAVESYSTSTGSYTVSATRNISDDYADDTSTSSNFSTSDDAAGVIETSDDVDWHKIYLYSFYDYEFTVAPESGFDIKIKAIYDSSLDLVADSVDRSSAGRDEQIEFTPRSNGYYYVAIEGYNGDTGSYTIDADII